MLACYGRNHASSVCRLLLALLVSVSILVLSVQTQNKSKTDLNATVPPTSQDILQLGNLVQPGDGIVLFSQRTTYFTECYHAIMPCHVVLVPVHKTINHPRSKWYVAFRYHTNNKTLGLCQNKPTVKTSSLSSLPHQFASSFGARSGGAWSAGRLVLAFAFGGVAYPEWTAKLSKNGIQQVGVEIPDKPVCQTGPKLSDKKTAVTTTTTHTHTHAHTRIPETLN